MVGAFVGLERWRHVVGEWVGGACEGVVLLLGLLGRGYLEGDVAHWRLLCVVYELNLCGFSCNIWSHPVNVVFALLIWELDDVMVIVVLANDLVGAVKAFEKFVFSFPFVDEECLVAWIVGGGDAFLICVSDMLGFDILMQVCEHGTELVNMALMFF